MSAYSAPLKDMQYALRELVDLPRILALAPYQSFDADDLTAVLEQAGAFAAQVLSPLNRIGDTQGCSLIDGAVTTASGWPDAYSRFAADGWNGLSSPAEHGGAGLPSVVSALTDEMWHGANCAFALCPMLTRSGIEALSLAAEPMLQAQYLPKLVDGSWTATMNLTEPQAGSDLAAVKTRALPQPDGSFLVSGQKIFITYGEHDLTDNIIHMVLARTPDAPPGIKGISLFLVPKWLLAPPGDAPVRNAVRCLSLEHKLGIHGSPTCVMQFGADADAQGARGWLIGELNHGLEYMFIMMNAARFSVGIQGIGLAERAYQTALAYARLRRQGSTAGERGSVAIVQHPDVRRMLLEMKSGIEAMRALSLSLAEATELARHAPDTVEREQAEARVGLLTPVVKGWCTESAVEIASRAIQVHGGMGYIEETGVAQLLRDARITPIYEGTTGIQANDLVSRKLLRDRGCAARHLIADMHQVRAELSLFDDERLAQMGNRFEEAVDALEEAVSWILKQDANAHSQQAALAGAEPLLMLFGVVCGGWQQARSALAAQRLLAHAGSDRDFLAAKLLTASFYSAHVLPRASALSHEVRFGAESVLAMSDAQFG